VPFEPVSVFVSVSVSVADHVFATVSLAVAVVPAATTSGYQTETVNVPLGDDAESDEATAAPTPRAQTATAARASTTI
jgi:hypothetical protein